MSIEITVRDPANTPRPQLALVIQLLQRFYDGGNLAETIALPDLPDAGGPDRFDAADAFPNGAQDANSAFGGAPASLPSDAFVGNVPPPPPEASPSAGIAANGISTTPDTAAGSGPNVAPPPPPNGTPPAPNSGAATAGASTLDSAGLPWDIRIHAKSSKGPGGVTVADGTWRKKAKVDPALVTQVEAQLRQLMATPSASQIPPPPAASHSVPAGYGAPPAPPPAAAAASAGFPEFMQNVGMAMGNQKITLAEVNAECAKFGIPDVSLLSTRLDWLPSIDHAVRALISSRG